MTVPLKEYSKGAEIRVQKSYWLWVSVIQKISAQNSRFIQSFFSPLILFYHFSEKHKNVPVSVDRNKSLSLTVVENTKITSEVNSQARGGNCGHPSQTQRRI